MGQLGLAHKNNVFEPTVNQWFIANKIKIANIQSGNSDSVCIDIKGKCYLLGNEGNESDFPMLIQSMPGLIVLVFVNIGQSQLVNIEYHK